MNKDDDKIVPFTEFNYKEMMELSKKIFTPEFNNVMNQYGEKITDWDKEIRYKIHNFLLELIEKENNPKKQLLMYRSILSGLYQAINVCYWGINEIIKELKNKNND